MIRSIHQSHINTWMRCPERFRRRYIEGEIMPPGIAARIGTGVHAGAEVSNKAQIRGSSEPKSVIVDAAVEGYKKSCVDGGVFFAPTERSTARRQLAEGTDHTATLAGLFVDSVAPKISPVAVEEKIVLDVPGLPLPFAGIIDWRESDPQKWGDLKTAARKWTQEAADTAIQPVLYPRLMESITGVLPTHLSYEILTKTKEPQHQTLTTTRTDDDWSVLLKRVRLMLTQINAGIFQPGDPSHWGCSLNWCGYFITCKYIPAWRKILPKKESRE